MNPNALLFQANSHIADHFAIAGRERLAGQVRRSQQQAGNDGSGLAARARRLLGFVRAWPRASAA